MTRRQRRWLYPVAILALIGGAGFLGLRGCYEVVKEDEEVRPAPVGETLIALSDGSTMVAERGTLGREMADWVDLNIEGQATFLLAEEPFVRGSTEPAPESWRRINRLAAMLRANRRVKARIVIYAVETGDPRADLRLAAMRAQRLESNLVAAGIARSRLTVEGQPRPAALGRTEDRHPIQHAQVAVTLSREPIR